MISIHPVPQLAMLLGASLALTGVLLALDLQGCAGSTPPVSPVVEANIAAYAAEEQECVSLAGSRAAADYCIQGVKDRWCAPGQPLADAGACLYTMIDAGAVVVLDGGAK